MSGKCWELLLHGFDSAVMWPKVSGPQPVELEFLRYAMHTLPQFVEEWARYIIKKVAEIPMYAFLPEEWPGGRILWKDHVDANRAHLKGDGDGDTVSVMTKLEIMKKPAVIFNIWVMKAQRFQKDRQAAVLFLKLAQRVAEKRIDKLIDICGRAGGTKK